MKLPGDYKRLQYRAYVDSFCIVPSRIQQRHWTNDNVDVHHLREWKRILSSQNKTKLLKRNLKKIKFKESKYLPPR